MAKKPGSSVDRPEAGQLEAAHLAKLEAQASKASPATHILIPSFEIETARFKLVGDSPLICNHWSEKAMTKIRDKQLGKATAGREPKDPEADFKASLYPYPGGGYGFPAIAFKKAAVEACTSLGKSVTKVQARQAFHVVSKDFLIKLKGTPRMREDAVVVGMGAADLRYRGEFPEWSADMEVRYNARLLSGEQVVNLFNVAGFAVGVGEWRVEKDGINGLFHVETI